MAAIFERSRDPACAGLSREYGNRCPCTGNYCNMRRLFPYFIQKRVGNTKHVTKRHSNNNSEFKNEYSNNHINLCFFFGLFVFMYIIIGIIIIILFI